MALSKEKLMLLLKTAIVFLVYICYTNVIYTVLSAFGLGNGIGSAFIADIVFLLFIVYIYKNELKEDWRSLFKENKPIKIFLFVFKYVVIIFLMNCLMAIFSSIMFTENQADGNTSAIYEIFNLSFVYTMFKLFIFSTIAEELLFKESIRENIDNKVIFVIVCSLIYAFMNIMYSDLSYGIIWIDFISYFVLSMIMATAYVRHGSNIFIVIMIKFIYNLIPFAIFMMGV